MLAMYLLYVTGLRDKWRNKAMNYTIDYECLQFESEVAKGTLCEVH